MTVQEMPTESISQSASIFSTSRHLISSAHCPSSIVTSYHDVLTNIDLELAAIDVPTIVVAGVDALIDASIVALNLGLTNATGGQRTLVIDADVQAPNMHTWIHTESQPGLTHMLRGETPDAVRPTSIPTLDLITCGANGSRHSRLDRFGDITAALIRLRQTGRRLFIAMAPITTSTDLLRVASQADGVVLVTAQGETSRQNAQRARKILDENGVRLLGVIFAD